MKRNEGLADRIIRIVLALTVGALYLAHQVTGTAAVVLGAVAVLLLVTGVVGFCPLYALLGLSSRRKGAVQSRA